MKKVCLFTWLLFVFGVSAFAQVGGSGTANTIAKFTASTTIGNSGVTDNGTTVSTGEAVSLTGTSYPNLFHEPVSYTALGIQGQPNAAPWQIFYGNTTTPITAANQDIFAEIVSNSGSSGIMPAAIRAYALQSAGTANTAAIEGVCQANTGTSSGTGCTTIHGVGSAGAASVDVFAFWAQTFDNGFNSGQTGIEIDTNTTLAGRTEGQLRGMNVVNFPGSGTTAGSSGDISNDWGVLISAYGNGLVLDTGTDAQVPYTASTRNLIRVRGTGSVTGNAHTTVLSFETPQTGPFSYGLDFRNATFSNAALVTGQADIVQVGKIGRAPGASNTNLVGTITVSAATSASTTFTNPYTNAPFCFLQAPFSLGTRTMWVSTSTTAVTANFSASTTGTVWYGCIANVN